MSNPISKCARRLNREHGGNRGYYAQELDYVQIPAFEAFRDAESYYAALAHELTLSTKHPQRLETSAAGVAR